MSRTAFVAKAELAQQLFAGAFLRLIGALFVDRFDDACGRGDLDNVIDTARADWRSIRKEPSPIAPGLLAFKLGAFAAAAGAPVVPSTLRGK